MQTDKKIRLLFSGFAILIGIIMELVFWKHEAGIGILLFSIVYIVGFLILTHFSKQIINKKALALIVPILIFGVNITLYNNTLVSVYCPYFVFILLFLFSVLLTLKNPNKFKFYLRKIPVVRNIFSVLNKTQEVISDFFCSRKILKEGVQSKILYGILFSIPFLIIFGVLFLKADAVFYQLVINKLFSFDTENFSYVFRFIRVLIISLAVAAFFYTISSREHRLFDKVCSVIKLDTITVSVVLGIINLFFIGFVIIQVRYLFGDVNFVIDNQLVFAQYARSGFFELIQVVLFAMLILGFIYRSFSHHGHSKVISILESILIVQISIIALSALKRMELYQDAYGFTILRLYVEWFIYTVFAVLLFAVVSLLKNISFKHFFHYTLILGLSAICIVSSLNVDYMIANKNIQNSINNTSKKNNYLDVSYLEKLSVDIVPALMNIDFKKTTLNKPLYPLILNLRKTKENYTSIFEYNIGKEKALKLEEKLEELNTEYNRFQIF